MAKTTKQEPITHDVSRILMTRDGVTAEITPMSLAFSHKDGHRLVYFDHAVRKEVTIPLAGCFFPRAAEGPAEAPAPAEDQT